MECGAIPEVARTPLVAFSQHLYREETQVLWHINTLWEEQKKTDQQISERQKQITEFMQQWRRQTPSPSINKRIE